MSQSLLCLHFERNQMIASQVKYQQKSWQWNSEPLAELTTSALMQAKKTLLMLDHRHVLLNGFSVPKKLHDQACYHYLKSRLSPQDAVHKEAMYLDYIPLFSLSEGKQQSLLCFWAKKATLDSFINQIEQKNLKLKRISHILFGLIHYFDHLATFCKANDVDKKSYNTHPIAFAYTYQQQLYFWVKQEHHLVFAHISTLHHFMQDLKTPLDIFTHQENAPLSRVFVPKQELNENLAALLQEHYQTKAQAIEPMKASQCPLALIGLCALELGL